MTGRAGRSARVGKRRRNISGANCRTVSMNEPSMPSDTDEELEREMRLMALASPEAATPDVYPELGVLSARFMFTALPVPTGKRPFTEYVRLTPRGDSPKSTLALRSFCANWNMAWESAELRQFGFRESGQFALPKELSWLKQRTGRNFSLVTDGTYEEYSPLYHLLPARRLVAAGLPLLKRGMWQPGPSFHQSWLPSDFVDRLSGAVARQLWPLLYPRPASPVAAFSQSDSLQLLAHNLDFWLPYLDAAIQERLLESMPLTRSDDEVRAALANSKNEEGFRYRQPLMGGTVWMGEEEAAHFSRRMVELADAGGRLRGIFEALESHRVVDDFTDRWSVAKAEFERKLYRKRSKTKVTFVELKDTVPIHAPQADTDREFFWQDLLAVVNRKERQILVLLRGGHTQAEIAESLGYAGHSPVSKALARILERAQKLLDS